MKYIHVLIKNKSCEEVFAKAIVFNECEELEEIKDIQYPVNFNKEDIAAIIIPNANIDYAVRVDWIGGRPNDRR